LSERKESKEIFLEKSLSMSLLEPQSARSAQRQHFVKCYSKLKRQAQGVRIESKAQNEEQRKQGE
jgi:hypothetical protein